VIPENTPRPETDDHPDDEQRARHAGAEPVQGEERPFDIAAIEAEDAEFEDDVEPDGTDSGEAADHGRPVIVVEGEGPPREIYRILRQMPAFRAQFEPLWLPSLARIHADTGGGVDYAGRVVACWRQITALRPDRRWRELGDAVPTAEIVTFPRLSMEFLWPFTGPDARRVPEPPVYKTSRYAYADRVAASLADANLPDDELFARYLVLSREAMPDLNRLYEDTVAAWRTREAAADIPVAQDVIDNFRSDRLFHAPGVPAGPPLIRLVRLLVERTARLDETVRSQILADLAVISRGYTGQPAQQWPIHPAVAEAYGLKWYGPELRYRVSYNLWGYRQYMLKYIRWAPWST
jgi:hypothetical protein